MKMNKPSKEIKIPKRNPKLTMKAQKAGEEEERKNRNGSLVINPEMLHGTLNIYMYLYTTASNNTGKKPTTSIAKLYHGSPNQKGSVVTCCGEWEWEWECE